MSVSRRSHDILSKALADRQAADEIVASVRAGSASGTVTSVSVVSANGVSGTVATATTTPAITLALGAITPTTIVASGAVSGSNLSGTNTGNQTIALTGDVTGTGTGSFAATIASAAVTYAKIQDEGAHSLIGNPTGSSAAPSEITLGDGLAFSGTTLVASGSSLPSGTAGQTLITDGATPAFSSIIEVYTATSPNATGLNSVVANNPDEEGGSASGEAAWSDSQGHALTDYSHADSRGYCTGTFSHADSHGVAAGLDSHADSAGHSSASTSHGDSSGNANAVSSHADSTGTTKGLQSHANSAGIAWGIHSRADSGGTAAGDNCAASGSNSYAGPVRYTAGIATTGGATVCTITGADQTSHFTNGSLIWIASGEVSGTIGTAVFTGGNTVITLTADLGQTATDTIFEPDQVTGAHAHGTSGLAELTNKDAVGGGKFAAAGDCQASTLVLSIATTNDTPAVLKVQGCASGTGLPQIRTNTTYGFTATVVGRSSSAADDVLLVRHGVIRDTAGTVALAGAVTAIGADAGTAGGLAWSVAITADNTGKALQVAVTGAAATNIHWVCKLECVEVG